MKSVEQMIIGDVNGPSASFKKFIKDIADSKTKYEESLVMQAEIEGLKADIKHPNSTPSVQHERLVKLIYIQMLGYDASFGVIDAIKFAQLTSVFFKRIGYLVASLLLNSNSQEALLLCCTLQKDLNSESVVEQSMALTAICQLMGKETISLFTPTIIRKLSHPKEIIRKKAVDVMYKFLCEQPEVLHDERYQKALCDPDAGVMLSTLPIYLKLTKERPERYRHMLKAFTDILTQIVEGRLHVSFNYHTFPAPWAQIYLLQILENIGANHQQSSESMADVLHMVVARASGKMTTAQANDAAIGVLYQVCTTILSIYPNQDLIQLVTRKIDELLNGGPNKLYCGLQLLYKLCEIQPSIGNTLVRQVCDRALEHPSDLIREMGVRVIHKGISHDNLSKSAEILLRILSDPKSSEELKHSCSEALSDIGKTHAPTPAWYVQLLIDILQRYDKNADTPPLVFNRLINYCMEREDESIKGIMKKAISQNQKLIWLHIWSLGRYDDDYRGAEQWLGKLDTLTETQLIWLFDSLIVLMTRVGCPPPTLGNAVQKYLDNASPILRQLAIEITNVAALANPCLLSSQINAITDTINTLECNEIVKLDTNSASHKQMVQKFKKRVNVIPNGGEYELEPDTDTPRQRVIPSANKEGSKSTANTSGWVSYHEHIPEEANSSDKPEPPLSQPALRTTRIWGQQSPRSISSRSHPHDSARC